MNIALVAHDARKEELIEWVTYNVDVLKNHHLYATGTTGRLLSQIKFLKEDDDPTDDKIFQRYEFPLKNSITKLLSGPLGGDQQIGAMIAEGKIDALIFFCDNLIVQGHQNDVSALTRLASLYNIAFATNRTTADMILTSPLFDDKEYKRIIPTAIESYKNRGVFNKDI